MNSPQGPTPPSAGGPLPPDLPEPDIVPPRRWLPSLVWIVPLIAALIGVALVVRSVANRGPTITISFASAEGLEPGKTKVKYKAVDIGSVRSIKLSSNLSHVLVEVELTKDAEAFALKDSRFWIVRPRVGATGVSGLGTLLSGSYIGADAGRSTESQSEFVGLETPPAVTIDERGHRYTLHGDSLGSLDIGSPIFYRRVQVGQVTGFSLDKDGTGVTLQVFVNAPYDQYVGGNTRWWHASGVNLQLDSSGFKLNTQSLATVIVGGIAFQQPAGQPIGQQAADNSTFLLASDENDAMREPDGPPVRVVMYFNQSLRGLAVGAPVDFRGITLGQVTDIGIQYDPKQHNFTMPVTMDLYPLRLSRRVRGEPPAPQTPQSHELLKRLVSRGLRGQLRTGNLLTGQLYIALDMFPKAAPAQAKLDRDPMELPTVPNTLDELQLQVADIAKKLDQVPFDQIGTNLNSALKNANQLFTQLNGQLVPQARDTLAAAQKTFGSAEATLQQDSPLQSDVHQALQELTRTLQSLNALSDYLERHPESLLRGKSGDQP
ncbi:intermembrane transport protein PqiB [Paraburkholderia caballeronis]|uniref:Paraquat-inducible protein B n=1 Tax=Paraburkholderia caballeronis TaxID=416943 RepID=A0A1H7I6C4_9BURK|nr:MlaD family protein [Paraburkholderia caballeronis]PXW29199.1 paraquat-inducible protein B [Paraburkholderia caballeronis]PXX04458.1 paraquat-inducible protein B [Paraburkholderia caballeronis]RAK05519.1 paraquat-inducible protein B [Paraburkholderia caballeronis]TDV18295.1 paraquat-inducible protein B [Paraburkholderia caballeronis]TDV20167.1 paraquat-inducible protein B [Paraburkholderia caballeronis]